MIAPRERSGRLLIDIGNRYIKWAWAHDIAIWLDRTDEQAVLESSENRFVEYKEEKSLEQSLGICFDGLDPPESVWISCVAGSGRGQEIRRACKKLWDLVPGFAEIDQGKNLIHNGYLRPEELGIDRWLSMIGARICAGVVPILIVDAGTAITIDFVNREGDFEGGVIFPGLMTMRESLNVSTGQIRVESERFDRDVVSLRNCTTCDAVGNGIVHAAVSAIDQAIENHRIHEGEELLTLITGGDAGVISKLSRHDLKWIPGLVLIGLNVVSGSAGA